MTKFVMTLILKKCNFLVSRLDDEDKWMRALRCTFYALLFLVLFLPTVMIDITSPDISGDNIIYFIAIGMNYVSSLLLTYMYIELFVDKVKVIWSQIKTLIIFTLIFLLMAIALYLFNLPIIIKIFLMPLGLIMFLAIHGLFILTLFRANLALRYLQSKKIAAIILMLIGITAIPVAGLLESFSVFFAPDNFYYMFFLMIIRSLFVMAYIGLLLLADVTDLSTIFNKMKFLLIISYTSITIFLELTFSLAYAHERLEFFFNNIYGLALPLLMGWIFFIGLSIYKLEYKFDKGYLKFILYFLRILSLLFGTCFILSLCGFSFFSFFILR